MNSSNALGFILLSALMLFVPTLAPAWFPPTGFDGTNGRALWLFVMGAVQGCVGLTFLVSHWVLPVAARVAAFRPQTQRGDAMLPEAAGQASVI